METVSVKISKEVFRQLSNLAQEQLRTVPKTIEWLLREYKERTESAQEYCEREPMKTRILEAMEEMQEGKNFKAYSNVKELFDDIR